MERERFESGESNLTVEKPDRCYLSQWSRSTTTVIGHMDSTYPLYDVRDTPLYLHGLSPQTL